MTMTFNQILKTRDNSKKLEVGNQVFTNENISEKNLSMSIFWNLNFSKINFSNVNFEGATFSDLEIKDITLSNSRFNHSFNTKFYKSNLNNPIQLKSQLDFELMLNIHWLY